MNGHRKDVPGNNPLILQLGSQEDAVTDAIQKLQQNGVNCIFFTKKELIQLNHNHRKDLLKDHNMRKTKAEQPNINDLLDYEPDIKSINASSLTIQLNNHNCLVSQKQNGKRKRGRRRKGKLRTKQKRRQCQGKGRNGLKERDDLELGSNKLLTIASQAPEFQEWSSKSDTNDIHHDYLTNGFSTPPPRLSPQYSDGACQSKWQLACPIMVDSIDSLNLGSSSPSQIPVLSPSIEIAEIFDDAVVETLQNLVNCVVRQTEEFNASDGNAQVKQSTTLDQEDNLIQLTATSSKFNDVLRFEGGGPGETTKLEVSYSDKSSLPLLGDFTMTPSHFTPDRSFYSLVTNNVRHNLENYLDGKVNLPVSKKLKGGGEKSKRQKRYKNGYLLYHGDNYPENPELSYKLNLTTQILLKLNRKRLTKPKVDKRKSMLSYLNLVSKRPVRTGKSAKSDEVKVDNTEPAEDKSVFSGEWTQKNKYVCGICGHEETDFWDMVTHKGEEHSGVVVTHVELPIKQEVPKTLIREIAQVGIGREKAKLVPDCTKCAAKFSTFPELHRHIFECSGNTEWLQLRDQTVAVAVKKPIKVRRRRRQGFKRRMSNTSPKKNTLATTAGTGGIKVETPSKRKTASGSTTNLYKCKFCIKQFKTEGWLKNHQATHTLLVSIPLCKLPKQNPTLALPQLLSEKTRASTSWSLRRDRRAVVTAQ